jgi:uncharacterized protein YaeQ
VVYCYGGRVADLWFAQNKSLFARQKNLTIINLPVASTQALAKLAQRNMSLQCTLQEGNLMMTSDDGVVEIEPVIWHGSPLTGRAWQS